MQAAVGRGSCCNHCGDDREYCSPVSGNCYIAKEKDYYHDCFAYRRLGTENVNNSMVSQNSAIDTASPNDTPGPLVNGSTFAEESMQAAVGWGSCCNHCGDDREYCSPVSGNCYIAKEKDYYHDCFACRRLGTENITNSMSPQEGDSATPA